jgi:Zn-dependent protease
MAIFSLTEIRDISISLAVLCVIFSYPDFLSQPLALAISLVAVGIAFIGHELSHKFAAIREGFWSEYRMWPQGLMMALFLAAITGGRFFFAAPGAVYFREGLLNRPNRRQLTRISMAGISFNVLLLWIFFPLSALLPVFSGVSAPIPILTQIALINGWLAIFNLIPFGGLDGQKLLRLNKRIWSLLLAFSVSGFILLQVF